MEVDEFAGAEGGLEGVEVWEGVVSRKEGLFGVGKLSVEDGANFGGIVFGLNKEMSSWRFFGDCGAAKAEEVEGHVPKGRCEF